MPLLCSGASPNSRERIGGGASRRTSTYRSGRERRRYCLRLALSLCVFSVCMLGGGPPALALSARGHEFSFAFAAGGPPSAIAVNSATGHVFVARPGVSGQAGCKLGCIEEFELAPSLHEARRVKMIEEVPDPENIAIDNAAGSPSQGDIYVSGTTKKLAKEEEFEENKIVYKYSSAGTLLAHLRKFKPEKKETSEEFEPILGLAVDAGGNLLVYDEEGEIAKFNNSPKNKGLFSVATEFGGEPSKGLAVDSRENLYVGHTSVASGAEGATGAPPVIGWCEVNLAERECETLAAELNREHTSAVASAGGGEVFLANVDPVKGGGSAAFLVGVACPTGSSSCSEIQRVGAPGLSDASGVAVDSTSGAVYVAGATTNEVDVFEPEPPGPPKVDALSVCVTSQCTPEAKPLRLMAEVDPAGADTHAYFEYGTSSCASSACSKAPEPPQDLGSGFGDVTLAFEPPADLRAGVTYHFRVHATNENGEITSAERTFTVPAPQAAVPLLDSRAWEQVSPPDKDGNEPEPIVKGGGATQASQDGSAVTYVADGPIPAGGKPEGSRTPEGAQILSVRRTSGWSTQDLSTANGEASGVNVGNPQEYEAFSSNLSLALLHPYAGTALAPQWSAPPLVPPLSKGEKERQEHGEPYLEKTAYLHADTPIQPESGNAATYAAAVENGEKMKNAGFVALVNEADALGVLSPAPKCSVSLCFGGGLRVGVVPLVGTPDLNHVLIKSWKAGPGLYEWSADGSLKLVSVTPQQFLGVVTEKSKVISSITVGESFLSPGEEISGEGIPPGATIVKQITKGEWEMSAEATSTTATQPMTVYASAGIAVQAGGGSEGGVTGGIDRRHAISDSGERVFWTDEEGPHHLYVRDFRTRETLKLDAQVGVSGGVPHPVYQTASADGTKVFFTDAQRLTADSTSVEQPNGTPIKSDLYVFELPAAGQPLAAGTLQDLTSGGVPGDGGDIRGFRNGGGVLGASEDGSYVYFVANAALSANAHAGTCVLTTEAPTPDKSCNLYVRHFNGTEWEPTKLIAVLSNVDSPDWGGAKTPGSLTYMSSRVSPSGHFLAFMSSRSLTGYDNTDKSPSAKGARDEEVFLYDAIQETIVCASCNPSGASPAGVFDLGTEIIDPTRASEGLGLIVDRPGTWGAQEFGVAHWLAGSVPGWTPIGEEGTATYQSRYLSDQGRLFFNSPDHLVPAATGAKEKVYEYEPPGVVGCSDKNGCLGLLSSGNGESEEGGEHESAFLDASESGNDVFFLTAAKLSTGDVDTNFDVYDARVCNQGPGASSCIAPPGLGSHGCESGEACKGPAPKAPTYTQQASAIVPAPKVPTGATLPTKEASKPKPLSKAQLLAKALKSCRLKYKGNSRSRHKKRAACEASARKKYGPHKKAKK
jgi:hypothetical protein